MFGLALLRAVLATVAVVGPAHAGYESPRVDVVAVEYSEQSCYSKYDSWSSPSDEEWLAMLKESEYLRSDTAVLTELWRNLFAPLGPVRIEARGPDFVALSVHPVRCRHGPSNTFAPMAGLVANRDFPARLGE